MAPRGSGLILVFDLDQTLIDTDKAFSHSLDAENANFKRRTAIMNNPSLSDEFLKDFVNHRLIDEVLIPASRLRGNGVDGIFLLTNNASDVYVKAVCRYLVNTVNNTDGNEYFFDYVMTRNDAEKKKGGDAFSKNLSYIKHMLQNECPFSKRKREPVIYIDDADLTKRLFFFDDQIYDLLEELSPTFSNHYIQIKGSVEGSKGFHTYTGKPEDDQTDYSLINQKISALQSPESAPSLKGGSRKRRRHYKKRLTKHVRRRKN